MVPEDASAAPLHWAEEINRKTQVLRICVGIYAKKFYF
jgi:hypothetical protein